MSGPHTGEDVTSPTIRPSLDIVPSKPVAHLTGETSVDVPSIIIFFNFHHVV